MNFCRNCHLICDGEYCPSCGTKKLYAVNSEDFCYLTEKSAAYCKMLISVFEENNIIYTAMPCGSGIESKFGLPLSDCKLYVQFNSLDKAKSILKQLEDSQTDKIKTYLLDNSNELKILAKNEKKLRKKIRLSPDKDFFEYCIDIIQNSNKIDDEGTITSCKEGGHYLFCYTNNVTLAINSATFEILSLSIHK